MAALPEPGDLVAGKYEVVRLLGRGGMGIVVEALHKKLDQRVALKFLLDDTNQLESVARFEREARAAARLRSPHVVRVIDVDTTTDGVHFIVLEYLEGHDVARELKDRQIIPVPEAVDWVLQACSGLAEAHARGIVHRDIKPANLFLADAEPAPVVKVMDFGISKIVARPGEAELTTTETTLGTPSYMAPEQVVSTKTIDHRADIWSLGVVLYKLVSGALPFSGATGTALAVEIATGTPVPISEVAPALPPGLASAIMKCLARDPSDRHADAAAFAAAIAPFGSGAFSFDAARVPPSAPRPSDPEIPITGPDTQAASALSHGARKAPAKRSRTPLALGAVGLAAVLGLGAWRLSSSSPAPTVNAPTARVSSAPPPDNTTPPALPEPPSTGMPPVSASTSAAPPPPARPPSRPQPSRSAAPVPTADPLHL